MMMIYGYARVSTDAQDLTSQLAQVKAASCERIFHSSNVRSTGLASGTKSRSKSRGKHREAILFERILLQKISGATADRPELKKLLKAVSSGDLVIILAVDRLSRDTTDLLVIARDLQKGRRRVTLIGRANC